MKTFDVNSFYDMLDDILRVENLCLALKTRIFNQLGVRLNLTIKTNWTRSDIPTVEHMERIRYNIETIAKVINNAYSINTFDNKFNYKNANDFEIAIQFTLDYLNELIKIISQPVAGFYCANETNVLIATR